MSSAVVRGMMWYIWHLFLLIYPCGEDTLARDKHQKGHHDQHGGDYIDRNRPHFLAAVLFLQLQRGIWIGLGVAVAEEAAVHERLVLNWKNCKDFVFAVPEGLIDQQVVFHDDLLANNECVDGWCR